MERSSGCREVGHFKNMAVKSPRWNDQRSFESGFEAMKDGFELVEAVEESEDQSQIHQEDSPSSHRMSNGIAKLHTVNGDHISPHIRVIKNLPAPRRTETSPTSKQRKLIANTRVAIAEHEENLEAVLLEKERVGRESAIVVRKHETEIQRRKAGIKRLKGQVQGRMSLHVQEQSEQLVKLANEEMEAKEKEHERKTLESEVVILEHMKNYLKIQVEEEKLRRLLAEAKLSLAKMENSVITAECDTVETN